MYSSACQKYTQHPKKPSKVNEEVEAKVKEDT